MFPRATGCVSLRPSDQLDYCHFIPNQASRLVHFSQGQFLTASPTCDFLRQGSWSQATETDSGQCKQKRERVMKPGGALRILRRARVWASKATRQTCLSGKDSSVPSTEHEVLQPTLLMGHRCGPFQCCLELDLVATVTVSRKKVIIQRPGIAALVASIPNPGRVHLVHGAWVTCLRSTCKRGSGRGYLNFSSIVASGCCFPRGLKG